MTKVRHIYVQVFLMNLLLMGILLILKSILSVPAPLRIVIQGLLLIALYSYLNHRMLRVAVKFYSSRVSLKSQLKSLIPVLLYVFGAIIPNIFLEFHSQFLLSALMMSIEAGVMEEYIYRGLFLGYLTKHSQGSTGNIWRGLILSSVLFGLAHATNFLVQPAEFTFYQILAAGIMGVLFGAIYLRTSSLVWPILIHTLQDFTVFVTSGFDETVHQTVNWTSLPVVFILFGSMVAILLRPKMMRKVALAHQTIEKS